MKLSDVVEKEMEGFWVKWLAHWPETYGYSKEEVKAYEMAHKPRCKADLYHIISHAVAEGIKEQIIADAEIAKGLGDLDIAQTIHNQLMSIKDTEE